MKKLYSWSEHFERCFASGMSKRAYCARHGISYQMFFYHQRKLLGNEGLSGFDQVSVNSDRRDGFAESTAPEDNLRVQLSSGAVIYFPDRLLSDVVGLLHNTR